MYRIAEAFRYTCPSCGVTHTPLLVYAGGLPLLAPAERVVCDTCLARRLRKAATP